MSRPTSQASAPQHARGLAAKTNTTSTTALHAKNPLPASDVRLFVTNLRLLDLDLRDDWPDITTQTFSARSADQKQRISSTEWALFRLFEIWDPTETSQKLRPFFPPLEPLQSLNLRAALYRCLNELKKTGVLGRESVLRKTMLDECKGDRFFELLALFSAAVLRKVLASATPDTTHAAVARKLATAPTLSSDQQRSLLPLAVAHRAALVHVLRRKDDKRRQFAHFAATLDSKAHDINKRTRRCLDTPRAKRPPVPQREADALKRQLADNWIGDQKWLAVMLHGDHVQAGDAFLSNRFDKVWHMVERGRKLEDAAPEAGLLQDLQSRVQEQQTRLQKWKSFHEELRRHGTRDAPANGKPPVPANDFAFDSHTQHQLPSAKGTERRTVQRPALRSTYQDILSDLDAELSRVSQSKPQSALASLRRRRRSSSGAPRSPVRTRRPSYSKQAVKAPTSPAWHPEPKTLVREPKTLVREQKALFEGLSAATSTVRRPLAKAPPTHSDATLVGNLANLRITALASPTTRSPTLQRFQPSPVAEPTPVPHLHASSSSPLPSSDSAPSQPTSEPSPSESPPSFSRSIPSFDIPALNPEEALADQIISAIGNATPSPVKKSQPRMSMSLVERTRMTLSRTPSFEPVPESPDLPVAPPTVSADAGLERSASLLDRTRMSMANMSSRPKRQHSVKSSQSEVDRGRGRESSFPVNQFDTPRALPALSSVEIEEDEEPSGTRTPREDLLSAADIDYDRVFKSRPKIATSPIFSPEKYMNYEGEEENPYEEEITGIDLGDVDMDDASDDGFTQTLDASPSKRPVRGRH
ncbi:hypothetical protein E8E12_009338 [Didymella heteroderae]|uniref:HAUS augmin-like complex subunit 6 N-terminal domain-containing protein n=1 Tax=Didymella heteroderae TaxID=1769908 RepID=A0A9P4WW61_9PLEO|nr:hypothetical protein E8E12_009338 [Didymella heteroderae]